MSDEFMLDTDGLKRRMDGALASLKTEFASLRTGRPRDLRGRSPAPLGHPHSGPCAMLFRHLRL